MNSSLGLMTRGPDAVALSAMRHIEEMYLIHVSRMSFGGSMRCRAVENPPSDDSHRLRYSKPKPPRHVQQKEQIGNDGNNQLCSVYSQEPVHSRSSIMALQYWSNRQGSHHFGSGMNSRKAMSSPGAYFCLHGRTSAHILKAEATGPKVPAIMGNAELANHHRLVMSASRSSIRC